MTFEVGLLFATVIGLTIGNLVFNSCIKLPEFDSEKVLLTEKTGSYEPNPDPCCSKIEVNTPLKIKLKGATKHNQVEVAAHATGSTSENPNRDR